MLKLTCATKCSILHIHPQLLIQDSQPLQEMLPSMTAHSDHKQKILRHHNTLCDDVVTKYLSSPKVPVKAPSMTIEYIVTELATAIFLSPAIMTIIIVIKTVMKSQLGNYHVCLCSDNINHTIEFNK